VGQTHLTRKRPAFSREERHELRYQLSVTLATLLSWFCFLIPTPLRYGLAERLGALFYRASHAYRANVEANIRQVLGDEASDADVRLMTRSIFRASARNFMDLLTLPRRSSRSLLRTTHLVEGDRSLIDDALATGSGVILVTGHVGCFDFIGQSMSAYGLKLTVVTGRTTSRFIFDGVTRLRGARGATMVEPTPGGVRGVIRALRRGECAVLLADRDFFQNGREVTFFGRRTTLPPGPVRIARDTGAPLIPIFTRRARHGHELRIFPPIYVAKTKDVDADVQAGLEQLVPVLEKGISDAADQWVMFQRVWPDTPPEPVRVFPVGSPLESELLEKVASHLPERKVGDGGQWLSLHPRKPEPERSPSD
jgi:KDO2-lipid IV(A) lauroyltransferase